MKHTVEAYDALVDKLKAEICELNESIDERAGENSDVNSILTDYLVKHAGVEIALEAAREIDKKFNIGFEECVDIHYVED